MSESNKTKSIITVSCGGPISIAFILLKLTGHIDWSWWWVLSPMWMPTVMKVAEYLIIIVVLIFERINSKE